MCRRREEESIRSRNDSDNTQNILFICGGAFEGLDKIISSRLDTKGIGFNADIHDKKEQKIGELLKQVLPQDFIKFGLIPEFIGECQSMWRWMNWMRKR